MSEAESKRAKSWLGVVDDIRTALAEAGRREVADRMPPGVLARFVRDGRWTLAEAAEQARRMSKPRARVAALAELAGSAEGPAAERLWIEAISIAATLSVVLGEWRLLASRLPSALAPRALETVAGIRDLGNRVSALTELLPHLPAELMPDAFAAVAAIGTAEGTQARPAEEPVAFINVGPGDELRDEDVWVPEGLCQIAPRLPHDLVPGAFDLADTVTWDEGRADALLCLSAYLPAGWAGRLPRQRQRDLVAELAAARSRGFPDESDDQLWQDLFTERLPDELLADAVAVAGAIDDPEDAAFMLAGLAPRLPGELLERARSVAGSLPAEARAWALAGILPHLLDDTRLPGLAGLLADVTSRADAEPPPWIRQSFYPPIAKPAPTGHRAGAASCPLASTWAAVTALADGWQRDYLIARLCPRLPDELLPEAVVQLTRMLAADEHEPKIPARALAALAPRMDEALLAQAWQAAVATDDSGARDLALAHLAQHMPASLVPQALRDATRFPLREPFGSHVRYAVLRAIAPLVPADLVTNAVDALVPVSFDPLCGHGRIGEAADVLAALVNRLPGAERHDVLRRALSSIEALDHEGARAQAVARIASLLPEDLIGAALAVAAGVSDMDDRAVALNALATRAPIDLLLAAGPDLKGIDDAEKMAAIRARLAGGGPGDAEQADAPPDAGTTPAETVATAWDPVTTATMLPIEWSRARQQVADALPLPAAPLPALVERFAATQVTDYPEEARAWALAGLAPHLPPEAMPDALATAAAIKDSYDRGGALVGLAPYLPDQLRTEALELARAMPDKDRMWTMAGFAPWLSNRERGRLITEVRERMRDDRRIRTLGRLAPWLPGDLIVYALTGTRSIGEGAKDPLGLARFKLANFDVARNRASVIAALVHAIPPERRDATLAAVLTRMAPYALGPIVSDLLPYLPDPLSPELCEAVMVLLEHRNHVRPLIDRLPAALLPQALSVVRPSGPATIAAVLCRAHALLAVSQPVRLAGLICQGLRIPQQTRAGCLTVVEAAVRSLAGLGPKPVIDACAAVFDEESAWKL